MKTIKQKFNPITMEDWSMAQAFYYYSKMAKTTYTVNISFDITDLRKKLKQRGYKFFPAYLYLVTKSINEILEMKIAIQDNTVGYFDKLTPLYPIFNETTKTISLLWTEYNDDFKRFYENYIEDRRIYKADKGVLSSKGMPETNAFMISCIPWFTFNSFSLHNHDIKDYYFPSFESCKFIETENKIIMPLSITANHATTEGYHLKLFIDNIENLILNIETWL